MAGVTTNFSWPFPTNPDVANVATDMQSLASAIDSSVGDTWTTVAAGPAAALWIAAAVNPVLNNGTVTVRYKKLGKTLLANYIFTMGGATTFGTGNYSWTLPNAFALSTTGQCWAVGRFFDSSTSTVHVGIGHAATTTTLQFTSHAGTAVYSPTVPWTWANLDVMSFFVVAIIT